MSMKFIIHVCVYAWIMRISYSFSYKINFFIDFYDEIFENLVFFKFPKNSTEKNFKLPSSVFVDVFCCGTYQDIHQKTSTNTDDGSKQT